MAKQASKPLNQWAFHVADVNVARFNRDIEDPCDLWRNALVHVMLGLTANACVSYVEPKDGTDPYIIGLFEARVSDHSVRKRLKKKIPMITGEYELIAITGDAAKYEKLMKVVRAGKPVFGRGRFIPKKKA